LVLVTTRRAYLLFVIVAIYCGVRIQSARGTLSSSHLRLFLLIVIYSLFLTRSGFLKVIDIVHKFILRMIALSDSRITLPASRTRIEERTVQRTDVGLGFLAL
jgi:hypothetical protein